MSEQNKQENEYNIEVNEWLEVAGLTDFITQYGNGASLTDLKLTDLYNYLRNPYANIREIQNASKYLTNKHGIIRDSIRLIKSLPNLTYHLHWSSYDDVKRIEKYERKVEDFLDTIDVKQFVRDGLGETAEIGTLVVCNRNNKYIQFLEIDDLRINKQRNGKWVIEYDLATIDQVRNIQDKLTIIESLPDEVSLERYNLYRKKGEDYRYVELKNCDLVNIDARRNFPYGLPFTLGSWSALLQKEIIDRVERSVADRLLKTIVILYAGHIDDEKKKPVPKPLIDSYFKSLSSLLQKKDGKSFSGNQGDTSGTGTIAFPHFFKLDTLKVDTEMFKKELYEKIENDIYANLGISSGLIYGHGSDYSSSQLNSEKLYKFIFTILEQFERIINGWIKTLLPNNLSCKLVFDRSTIANKDKMIDKYKEFYLQTNIIQPWAESLFGVDYKYMLSQAEYENKILGKEKVIYPAANAYTTSGDNKGGRPEADDGNENTNYSKSKGSNNNPRPSTN